MIDDAPKMVETTEPVNTKEEAFLKVMRSRLDRSIDNEKDEREKGLEDIRFINGDQWPDDVKSQRGNRLTLTINKLPTSLDQIDGDIRLNAPTLKVKAVDDAADPGTADVLEGLLRYIQRNSRATKVHSYAGLHAAAGGRGAWRIRTDYADDSSFRQEITIRKILDAYSVYYDPDAEQDDKQDGKYMFIVHPMSKEAFREEYNCEPVDFETDGAGLVNWQRDDQVLVAEYFWKEVTGEKTIHLMDDGSITEAPKGKSVRSRTVPVHEIRWALVDGKRVLEEGKVPGKLFPIVLTWGKQLCVDGKVEIRGIARHVKDAQRLYNFYRSNDAEAVALQPKQPYLIPDVLLTKEYQGVWDRANEENFPYLPYKHDPQNPGLRPIREAPAMSSSANQQQIIIADNEINDTTGIQKAALGKESNETSGVAIQKRKQESDTGQYPYIDNLGDAIVTEGKIIIGMIPEIYDYESQVRILGRDLKEKLISINDGQGIDFTVGRYDVDISIDGSYSTQREEFQEKVNALLPVLPPEHIAAISDLLFEMQDFHRADDIAERLKKLLPPGLAESDDPVDEGAQPMPQPMPEEQQPDPAAMAETQKAMLDIEMAKIELQQEMEKLEQLKLETAEKRQMTKEQIMALVNQMIAEGAANV